MSSIYVLEPPTKGKVVLSTSVGDIDIELWPKEAPKAVRYYSLNHHTIFVSRLFSGLDSAGSQLCSTLLGWLLQWYCIS